MVRIFYSCKFLGEKSEFSYLCGMIVDSQTNKVFFAKGLKNYTRLWDSLVHALRLAHVPFELLPVASTKKEIWARDYMPVQLNDTDFLQYTYNPDYLRGTRGYLPDYRDIDRNLGLNVLDSDLVLDGGNIIKCGDKVILTDKIFQENPGYSQEELLAKLEALLHAKPVIIPWDTLEEYGHADGMVRYIADDRVLLNCYADFDPELREKLLKALSPFFHVEELHFGERNFASNWGYINFLRVGNKLFIPQFGVEEDESMFQQIQRCYKDCECYPVHGCETLAKDGGVLNCVSWNVKQVNAGVCLEDSLKGVLESFHGSEGMTLLEKLASLDAKFRKIATQVILGGYIQVNKRRLYICDVEFYYQEETGNVKDPQMYHTCTHTKNDALPYIELGRFYTHLGLDVTFENPAEKYRASVLLRGFYVAEDEECPYGKGLEHDSRYSYIHEALLKDMSIFEGIQMKWVDEKQNPDLFTIVSERRQNINDVSTDPTGYVRKWRFKLRG